MTKQELTRIRNPIKWRLSGYTFPNNKEVLTQEEILIISEMRLLHKRLMNNWDENSKELGLKVPEHKCYMHNCRNKVIAVDERFNFYTCKKHKDNDENWILINKKNKWIEIITK